MHRTMLSMVGLGSVSDYLARNLDCATLIVKIPPSNSNSAVDAKMKKAKTSLKTPSAIKT
jgi:hypothetical protein